MQSSILSSCIHTTTHILIVEKEIKESFDKDVAHDLWLIGASGYKETLISLKTTAKRDSFLYFSSKHLDYEDFAIYIDERNFERNRYGYIKD